MRAGKTMASSRTNPPPSAPVLITGATGFIGRHICERLRAAGIPLRIFTRPRSAHRVHTQSTDDVVCGELSDAAAVRDAVRDTRAIIYAAGAVRGRTPDDFAAANIDGVETFARALSDVAPATPILLISSLAAGEPGLSHYAASKAQGEKILHRLPGCNWTILRPPAVYGPGDVEMRALLRLARRGLILRPGPPRQRISLIHVTDLASAVSAWLGAPQACSGLTYSLDDGYWHESQPGYAWSDIARILAPGGWILPLPGMLLRVLAHSNAACSGVFGYAPMLTPGKVRELQHEAWVCDNRPLQTATGWEPRIALAEGVANTFAPERSGGAGIRRGAETDR